MKSGYSLLFPAMLFLCLSGCGGPDVISRWLTGEQPQWQGTAGYPVKGKVSVSAVNDSSHLYVRFVTMDQTIAYRVLSLGMTVWLDQQGKKKKRFGIRFPFGRKKGSGAFRPDEQVDQDVLGRLVEYVLGQQYRLEILGPDKNKKRWMQNGKEGIEVKADYTDRKFIYELKMPLWFKDQWGYVFDARSSSLLGIGIESPKPDIRKMMEEQQGRGGGGKGTGIGMRPGRSGGRGGMGKGGRMGGRGSGSPGRKPPEAVKLWIKVRLASR